MHIHMKLSKPCTSIKNELYSAVNFLYKMNNHDVN